jgi:subtilase family serine protease
MVVWLTSGNSMRNVKSDRAGARRALVAATALAFLATISTAASAAALLSTHVPSAVLAHAVPIVGEPDPASWLQIEVALPMRNQAQLDAQLDAIYDPASPQYRHYLSVAEFTNRFGPTAHDYATAVAFFQSHGLDVTALSANRYLIEINGSVAAIEKIFHIKLHYYRHPTEQRSFIAPDREPTLDLAVPVLHVTGLDDFDLPYPRLIAPSASPQGATRTTGSGPGGNFIGSDMRAAYYGGTALTGKGQSVGLMELEGYIPSDIPLYFKTVHQPLNVQVNGISTDGTPVDCGKCNDGEQALDIEYAISMAPGLDQVQVYVAHHPVSVLNRMASDNISKQLSTSWGWAGQKGNFAVEDPIYKEMAMQGQTFLTASGDYSSLQASGPWPEEDANLTGVGGTDLVTNGPGGSYKTEMGWADSAGGPSTDRSILIPPFQVPFINAKNMGSHTLRNVPDVAANANFDMYICYQAKCNGGWGGTSFASPMWAGFIALANEQAATDGKPVIGFVAKTLYDLSKKSSEYKTIFHDVVGGKSGNYTAVKGFDLVTGLGSPNGQGMIDALTK